VDYRESPHDLVAEQSVVGSMILSPGAVSEVAETLRSPDFYRPAHQTLFELIVELSNKGVPADVITLRDELHRRGQLTKVGGAPYLHELTAVVPTVANAGYYAKIVKEKATLRRMIEVGERMVNSGYEAAGLDVDALVDRAQAEALALADGRTGEDYIPLSEVMPGTLDEIEAISARDGKLTGVPTGFADLDELTQGLHPGQMVIVAARPAIGKSTLGVDFCRAASIKNGLTSAIFSLEMSRSEIGMRLLSAEARVSLHAIRAGKMSDDDWTRVARCMGDVSNAPMFIDDSPNMSMMEIRAKCRRLKQQHDLQLVVVDYLQLMSSPSRVESRQVEVSEFSRSLKLLAKELNVPVVAISQLNRGPEQRSDKKPMISDLRESGSLEQDADVVILLNREDAYDKESPRAGEADLIVAKHRNGPTATVTVAFQGHYSRFVDMAH
jgi:replicative DNA helicase